MSHVVYIDILFLINFMINLTLLKITSAFLKRDAGILRLCFASVFGAVYAVCMFFPDISFLYIFPFKILVSAIMVRIICPRCHLVRYIKSLFIFLLVSFTFAGVLLALVYFTGSEANGGIFMSNGIFYFGISFGILIAASLISYVVIVASTAILKRSKNLGIKKLRIRLGCNECEIAALSDTGNLLCDPISRNPVIIAEKKYIQPLFPNGMPDCESEFQSDVRLRVIPYSSLGKQNGMLTGFIPDDITIEGRKTKAAIIAISDNVLSPSDEYNALFNPNIIL